VATNIAKTRMRDKMVYWQKCLETELWIFAYINSSAIYYDKKKSRFMEWYRKLPTMKVTFMSGGIGSELLDDNMNMKRLESKRLITLFSQPSFIRTIKESADQLFGFCMI
jgi:hypothetical protein